MPSHRKRLWLWYFVLTLAFSKVWSDNTIDISQAILGNIESKYGLHARKRVESWQQLIRSARKLPEIDKLKAVNQFFNQIEFVADLVLWRQPDYWATPMEMLVTNGGDCEDYAIAKYFTLKALGVAENKMHLTYVKALQINQAHMVLSYYSKPANEPIILDNLVDDIAYASKRPDLIPVYSFNGDGLWIAKQRGIGKRVGKSKQVGLWQEVLARMRHPSFAR